MSLVLNVEILGEYKKLQAATIGAQSTLKGLGTSFVNVGKKIATIVAGIGVGLGVAVASQIKPAIDAASDLEQQFGGLEAVFKDLAPGMKEFASQQYKIGLSSADAARSMVLLGSQLKGYGMPVDEAASKTKDLTLLAADLAATFGGTTADAVSSISALFRGEYDPIEKFGVALKKSDVNARPAAEGLSGLTGEALKQAEAQAALTILYEKTTDAQGQSNREMDTAAARSQRLQAELMNLKAEIGDKLLPIFVQLVSYITENIIPKFQEFWAELTDPYGEVQTQFGALGDAFTQFVSVFNSGSQEIKSNDVFKWLGDSMVSVVKMATHMATFIGEVFEGITKVLAAGFGRGPLNNALRTEGMKQVVGALGKANAAAAAIKFADQIPSTQQANPGELSKDFYLTINVNRATVNPDDIIDAVGSALKSRGLTNVFVK